MRRALAVGTSVALLAAAAGCGSKRMVPPRIDLKQHEVIGIIGFNCPSASELCPLATRKFLEAARQDQGTVRVIELGSEAEALKKVGQDRLDQAAFQALGRQHGVSTIITGELVVSDVKPGVAVTPGLDYASVSAEVEATLAVKIVETSSGASIWSRSASDTKPVGHVSLSGGRDFTFDADDPEKAYGRLVNSLVDEVTTDFRVTRAR